MEVGTRGRGGKEEAESSAEVGGIGTRGREGLGEEGFIAGGMDRRVGRGAGQGAIERGMTGNRGGGGMRRRRERREARRAMGIEERIVEGKGKRKNKWGYVFS